MRGFSWKQVGQRMRVVRIALGITEQEAARAWGLSLRTYRKYEAGARQVGDHFLRFAKAYDVSTDWVILGEGTHVAPHLSRNIGNKIAIMPLTTVRRRRVWARIAEQKNRPEAS